MLAVLCGVLLRLGSSLFDRPVVLEHRVVDDVFPALLVLLGLTGVPVLHGAVVAGDAAVDLGGLAALRAGEMLAADVAVVLADGVGGREGVVGQLVVLGDLAHEVCCGLPARQLLAEEGVEDGAGGVARLEIVLNVERGEDIVGVADRQVRAVGVVRGAARLRRGDDVGIELNIVLCQTVGGGLCGSSLEVIQVAVLLLIITQTFAHMVEHFLGELLALGACHVRADPLRVETGFVHADKADG